ncbi:MAG: MFS transporter [Rhodobacteraceae bacterium]|nr:MFS transporter [Paracoccaceae bacterium]
MRWRILALLFLARIGTGFQFQALGSVGDDLIVAHGLDYAAIGLLIGLFMAPGLFLALPAGFLGGYVPDRTLAVAGLLALSAGGFVSGFAADGWIIGTGRVIAGAGFLLISLYFTKMVADWFSGREIATAMAILVTSWPIGIAIGQVGHVWLAQNFGWQAAFLAASGYCLLAGLCVFAFYRPPGDERPAPAAGGIGLSRDEWWLVICAGCAWGVYNAGYVVYLSFGPLMLESQGYSALAAAATISLASWLMIASFALCGQIADRLGHRNTILTVCMAAAVVSLWLLSVPGAGLGASVLFGLIGFAPAGVIMALAGEAMRPERRAFGMGVFFSVYFWINAAVPVAAGFILETAGGAFAAIVFGMVLFASVVPFALLFRWRKAAAARALAARAA